MRRISPDRGSMVARMSRSCPYLRCAAVWIACSNRLDHDVAVDGLVARHRVRDLEQFRPGSRSGCRRQHVRPFLPAALSAGTRRAARIAAKGTSIAPSPPSSMRTARSAQPSSRPRKRRRPPDRLRGLQFCLAAGEALEIRLAHQRAVAPGRTDFEAPGPGDGVGHIEHGGHRAADRRAVIQRYRGAVGAFDHRLQDRLARIRQPDTDHGVAHGVDRRRDQLFYGGGVPSIQARDPENKKWAQGPRTERSAGQDRAARSSNANIRESAAAARRERALYSRPSPGVPEKEHAKKSARSGSAMRARRPRSRGTPKQGRKRGRRKRRGRGIGPAAGTGTTH